MAVLILLPPSEGKRAPAAGRAVDLASLSHPELAEPRRRVGDALVRVSGQRNALAVLGAGPSLAEEVAHNTRLWEAPAAPAAQVYTGVLYDAAGAARWDASTLNRAAESVRIFSALWGAVSPADHIPAYRLSAGTALGRLGAVGTFWRSRLGKPLDALTQDRLVIDCRSAGYAAMWAPPPARTVAVRVERELDGRRTVVSHLAKHTRGILTGHLLATDAAPDSPAALADAAAELIGSQLKDVALSPAPASGKSKGVATLTLVVV